MKIGIARIYTKNNDFQYNFENIKALYDEADKKGLEIIIFPRLAVSGLYMEGIEYLNDKFLKKIDSFLEKVIDLTYKKKCKMLIGDIYFEPEYEKNNIKYGKKIFDSVFFIDSGKINSIISRKYFSKDNPLKDILFFDKSNFISFFEYDKKKFSVLIADDIFFDFNILLASEQKPDYIFCLDSSVQSIEFKQKHLIKLAKFSNCPVVYVNSASYLEENLQFHGEIILIDEEFKLKFFDFYKENSIFDFFLDYEDGTEMFINNSYETNRNKIHILRKEFENKILNVDCGLYSLKELENLQENIANINFVQFSSDDRKYNKIQTKKINIADFVNATFYEKISEEERTKVRKMIIGNLNG